MAERSPLALIRHDPQQYGDTFKPDLFEQYKMYVESAHQISERRVAANNYLLTVNASLVTLYGLIVASDHTTRWIALIPFAGFLVCLTWHRMVTSYRDLNTVKFKVIHELERHLPAALFDYEWQLAEEGKGRAYRPLSDLERWIPVIFMVVYVLLAAVALFERIGTSRATDRGDAEGIASPDDSSRYATQCSSPKTRVLDG